VSAHRFPGAALVARLDVPEDLSVIVVDLSPDRLVAFAPDPVVADVCHRSEHVEDRVVSGVLDADVELLAEPAHGAS
jgi:hypothetical protein